ncbi:MAG: hypothetical protein J6Y20_08920 [Lachnospiraceae bacterium]|nr:hypothetical protein [Lachnospiraceae bacterium]
MSAVVMVLVWLMALVNGAAIGLFVGYLLWHVKKEEPVAPAQPTDEERELAMREREELIESQKAFRQMMNYNADIAYGISNDNLSTGGS